MIKRLLASLIASALIVLSPGLDFYVACAAVIEVAAPAAPIAIAAPGIGFAGTRAPVYSPVGQQRGFAPQNYRGLPSETARPPAPSHEWEGEPAASAGVTLELGRAAESVVQSAQILSSPASSEGEAQQASDEIFSRVQDLNLRSEARSFPTFNGAVTPAPVAVPNKVERSYRSGLIARNVRSAGAAGAITGLTAGSIALAVKAGGVAALHSTAAWLAGIMLLPAAQEILRRLLRAEEPKGLPELSRTDHPEIYAEVKQMSERAGIEMPQLLFWEKMDAPNAAAMGFHLPVKVTRSTVLFTPSILKLMPPKALAGVVGHELSHIRHNDLVWKIGAKLAGFVLFMTAISLHVPAPAIVGALVANELLEKYIGRQREYLADLGGARLNRNPVPLANGLLRLDIWGRLTAGVGGPVNRFDPGRLLHEHPSTLSRAETLLAMNREIKPAQARGVPASVAAYASVFMSLTMTPALVVAFMQGGMAGALFVGSGYLVLKGLLKLNKRLRPVTSERVRRDFSSYLTHPDPVVRQAVVRSILDFTPKDVATARAVGDALKAAGAVERKHRLSQLMVQAQEKYTRFEEKAKSDAKKAAALMQEVIAEQIAHAAREGRVKEVPQAAAQRVYLVDAAPRAPPVLFVGPDLLSGKMIAVFWHIDAAKKVIHVARPTWEGFSESQRADLISALSGDTETPALKSLKKQALKQFYKYQEENKPDRRKSAKLSWKLIPALAVAVWVGLERIGVGRAEEGEIEPSRGDRLAALGFGLFSGVLLTLATGWVGFPLGLINYFTALRFIRLNWSRGLGWRLKPLGWLLPSATLEVLAISAGAPMLGGMLWWTQAFMTGYLLRQNFKSEVPKPLEILLAAASTAALGIGVAAVTPHGFLMQAVSSLGMVAASAFFMHLARYQRRGVVAWGGSGLALVAAYLGVSALAGPLFAAFAVALTAHILGKVLTKGLKN